jgi:hypothetical protein
MIFNRVFFSLLAITVLAVVALNYAVDPLGRFRLRDRFYFSVEREFKPMLLQAGHYDGIILGSSKVTYIQPELLGLPGRVLNAAFVAATPEEMYYFVRDYEPAVKWIGIGLDYYMFNSNSFPYRQQLSESGRSSSFEYLISKDTLSYSIRTLRDQIRHEEAKYTRYGAENAVPREQRDTGPCCDYAHDLELLSTIHFHDFEVSERRFAVLKQLQRWADQRNIRLLAWMNPYNDAVYALAKELIPSQMAVINKKLAGIFSNYIDLTRAYPEAKYYWKNDPYHYYPSTATLFFRQHLIPVLNKAGNE